MTIAFFGDSLTNQGYFSDHVLHSLYQTDLPITGFNAGISGNRLLLAGTANSQWKESFGLAGVQRFRDNVITHQPDIVIGLIGTNDLLHPGTGSSIAELPSAEQMITGYQRLYNEADANNTSYIALTIPPFGNSSNHDVPAWNNEKEILRQTINTWLLAQPNTIDSASFLTDADHPHLLKEAVDCGDHIHFSENGGKLLGTYIFEALLPLLTNKLNERGPNYANI
ncbi:GDSL-type esterase/lipase family protein [Enterococcus termitis]